MIRADKMYQWAPTQMAMAHEPGQVLDDEQIEARMRQTQPMCITGVCSQGRGKCPTPQACQVPDPEDGQPTRQAVPEGGALIVLLPVALLIVIAAVRWYAGGF